jgi:beta-galactosidase beta subunit
MIFGNLNNTGNEAAYPEPVKRALNYLKANDMLAMEAGVYELDGRKMYVQVIDTKYKSDRKQAAGSS